MRVVVLFVLLNLASWAMAAQQPKEHGLVHWLTIEEAAERNAKQPRPIIVDVYTDWCGWCKRMMQTTYSQPAIAEYINTHFYPVMFNAESRDTVEFLDKTWVNQGVGRRPTHDLAKELLGNKLTYPSTVFFNNDYEFRLVAPGYLDPKGIQPLLVYTLENVFRTTSFDEFRQAFEQSLLAPADSSKPVATPLPSAARKAELKPKKTLLFVTTDWCNSCRVMKEAVFTQPEIKKYLDENYYIVYVDAQSKDSLTLGGQIFPPGNADNGYFHSLVLTLGGGKLTLPSMVILDESATQIVTTIPYFMSAANLAPALRFFADDAYLDQSWESYLAEYRSALME